LHLLNPIGDGSQLNGYMQEQVIMTLAMVADASELTFAKHCIVIIPLLLNILRNAEN